MADITMCQNTKCPKSGKCYRFIAKSDEYQSYFEPDEKECEHFLEANKSDLKRYEERKSDK